MNEYNLLFNWRKLLVDKEFKKNLSNLICDLGKAGFFDDCKIKYDCNDSEKVKEIFDKYHFEEGQSMITLK